MFCIILFLCAASLFGTIIAQVNEIVSQLTTKKKDLEFILASYVFVKPRLLKTLMFGHVSDLNWNCYDSLWCTRLDNKTMFRVREWERFQFAIDYQHQQVWSYLEASDRPIFELAFQQHKKILERTIPDVLKLSIARKIENNLFSKVFWTFFMQIFICRT